MTTPLAKDFDVYDLTADRVVDGPWPPRAETPLAVVAEPDALAPAKKKGGRPKGSKNAGKPKKAKAAKAKLPPPPVDSVPETQAPVQSLRIAAGGDGVTRFFNIALHDRQLWVYVVGIVALVASLAFLTGALKP